MYINIAELWTGTSKMKNVTTPTSHNSLPSEVEDVSQHLIYNKKSYIHFWGKMNPSTFQNTALPALEIF